MHILKNKVCCFLLLCLCLCSVAFRHTCMYFLRVSVLCTCLQRWASKLFILSPQIANPQMLGFIPRSQIRKVLRHASPQFSNPQIIILVHKSVNLYKILLNSVFKQSKSYIFKRFVLYFSLKIANQQSITFAEAHQSNKLLKSTNLRIAIYRT